MEILCPLDSKEEVIPLINAGADVFYAGIISSLVFDKDDIIISCRSKKDCNFTSINKLKEAINLIHKRNKKINLTLNGPAYSIEQIERIKLFLKSIKNIDGLIISDINLIQQLKKEFKNLKLIASSGAHILNKDAIEFYRKLRIDSIIIPRHLTITEIKDLIKEHKDVELECFIKNEDCQFVQGLCYYTHFFHLHNDPKIICKSCKFKIIAKKNKNKITKRINNYGYLMTKPCGACKIHDLNKMGIKKIKIVGRGRSTEEKIQDVKFIKSAIDYLDSSKETYYDKIKRKYKKTYGYDCHNRCMYE